MAGELDLDDNPYRAAYAQSVVVGETDAEAERLYAKHVEYSMSHGSATSRCTGSRCRRHQPASS